MKLILTAVLSVALTVALSSSAALAKTPTQSAVHVTAMVAVKALAIGGGMRVPKVYVLSNTGALQFESERDSGPDDNNLYAAISRPAGRPGKPHPVTALIPKSILASIPPSTTMVVSLESGSSIGACGPCEMYYPEFERRLGKIASNVRWVRIKVEKNDFVKR